MSTSLSNISAARKALAKASTLADVLTIRDKAEAIRIYVKAAAEGLEAQNAAAEIKLRAERKAGEMLAAMEKNEGGRPSKTPDIVSGVSIPASLSDLGVTEQQSSRWQREAKVSDEDFEQYVESCREEAKELTQAGLLNIAKGCHVSQATGENEWYTPPEYIEMARQAMGEIGLDPASCKQAQKIVKAKRYYTIEDDGLNKEWSDYVWLNPPYSKDLCSLFIDKLKDEMDAARVLHACVLVNNATDTAWCQKLLRMSAAICLVSGRIRFTDKTGQPANSPLQGQIVVYCGLREGQFMQVFQQVGACFIPNYLTR